MSYPSSIYAPLQDSDEIRLLELQPWIGGTRKTRVTLFHARLTEKPQYEALSYMWGSKETKSIHMSENSYEVRVNLWDALEHMRLIDEPRIIWIDAICINQHDINERNHQVSQMGKIFMNASRVVVWLGLAENSSNTAVRFLGEKSMNIQSMQTYSQVLGNFSTTDDGNRVLGAIKALCLRE